MFHVSCPNGRLVYHTHGVGEAETHYCAGLRRGRDYIASIMQNMCVVYARGLFRKADLHTQTKREPLCLYLRSRFEFVEYSMIGGVVTADHRLC